MTRISIPKRLQMAVFYRDYWHCRYCLEPVFFNPTLKLLDKLSPGHGYYHPHGKTGDSLPLFQWYFASADHIRPVADGGENSLENLVTACWKCNLEKRDADPTKYPLLDVPLAKSGLCWDGLASIYQDLPVADPEWVSLIRDDYGTQ